MIYRLTVSAAFVIVVALAAFILAPNPQAPEKPALPGVTSTSSATPGE